MVEPQIGLILEEKMCCGVFLEKNWVGVGVVVSYRRKIVLMLLLECVI